MMGEKQPQLGRKQYLTTGSFHFFPRTWLELVPWGLAGSSYLVLVCGSGKRESLSAGLLLPCLELDI